MLLDDKICICIAKKWSNSRTKYPKKGVHGGKKYLTAYFMDSSNKFSSKRITRLQEIELRIKGIYHRKRYFCEICGIKFDAFMKKKNIPNCPNCNQ